MKFLKIPITIYQSDRDVELLLNKGEPLTQDDFDSIDEYLDYVNEEDKEVVSHLSSMILNLSQIESIQPIFSLEATKEDEKEGKFDRCLITMISGEKFNCDWNMTEMEKHFNLGHL